MDQLIFASVSNRMKKKNRDGGKKEKKKGAEVKKRRQEIGSYWLSVVPSGLYFLVTGFYVTVIYLSCMVATSKIQAWLFSDCLVSSVEENTL